ncbi:hypothetical protein MKEN_00664500 [Mycena kentingensis (nom. inval.)]|nr:hypothetical protein MKEN_00664500 [Mycena kentingensis (nom. inval.)]
MAEPWLVLTLVAKDVIGIKSYVPDPVATRYDPKTTLETIVTLAADKALGRKLDLASIQVEVFSRVRDTDTTARGWIEDYPKTVGAVLAHKFSIHQGHLPSTLVPRRTIKPKDWIIARSEPLRHQDPNYGEWRETSTKTAVAVLVVCELGTSASAVAHLPAPNEAGKWTKDWRDFQAGPAFIHCDVQHLNHAAEDLPHSLRSDAIAELQKSIQRAQYADEETLSAMVDDIFHDVFGRDVDVRKVVERESANLTRVSRNGPWNGDQGVWTDNLARILRRMMPGINVSNHLFAYSKGCRGEDERRKTASRIAQARKRKSVVAILSDARFLVFRLDESEGSAGLMELKLWQSAGDEKAQLAAALAHKALEQCPDGMRWLAVAMAIRGATVSVGSFLQHKAPGQEQPQHELQMIDTFGLTPIEATAAPSRVHCLRVGAQIGTIARAMRKVAEENRRTDPRHLSDGIINIIKESLPKEMEYKGVKVGSRGMVVVKFVLGRYGEAEHNVLADHGFAPKLYTARPLAGSSCSASDAQLTNEHIKQLEEIRKLMATHKIVHGDLRSPNVFVCAAGSVKVIDFDWAGKAGDVTYPLNVSPRERSSKAVGGGKIELSHDEYQLAVMQREWRRRLGDGDESELIMLDCEHFSNQDSGEDSEEDDDEDDEEDGGEDDEEDSDEDSDEE